VADEWQVETFNIPHSTFNERKGQNRAEPLHVGCYFLNSPLKNAR
jgi:hypothetical protein